MDGGRRARVLGTAVAAALLTATPLTAATAAPAPHAGERASHDRSDAGGGAQAARSDAGGSDQARDRDQRRERGDRPGSADRDAGRARDRDPQEHRPASQPTAQGSGGQPGGPSDGAARKGAEAGPSSSAARGGPPPAGHRAQSASERTGSLTAAKSGDRAPTSADAPTGAPSTSTPPPPTSAPAPDPAPVPVTDAASDGSGEIAIPSGPEPTLPTPPSAPAAPAAPSTPAPPPATTPPVVPPPPTTDRRTILSLPRLDLPEDRGDLQRALRLPVGILAALLVYLVGQGLLDRRGRLPLPSVPGDLARDEISYRL